jgi:predicted glycoside hydrolase/deacetylase ChbG (UPF0249 family)
MASIIVNADDLGRSVGINDGIFEAHSRGLVTSATLMVGFPAAEDAAQRMALYPDLGVGLHATLTGGAPTLPPKRVPSLVDSDGQLPRRPEALAGVDCADVLAELSNQFALFTRLTGRAPTHLDSHHHSHRLPVVLEAIVTLARQHDLPVRRASAEVGHRLRLDRVRTTDAFVERFFGPDATLEALLDILHAILRGGAGVTEIMCHPGYADDELRRSSTYADAREAELEVLTHPEAFQAIRELELTPVHFGTAFAGSTCAS